MNDGEEFIIPVLENIKMREYLELQKLRLRTNQQITKEFSVTAKEIKQNDELNAYHADLLNLNMCTFILKKIDEKVTNEQVMTHLTPSEIAEICIAFYNLKEEDKKKINETGEPSKK